MSQLKLSFGGERILTAARLTQLNERQCSKGGEGVWVCVLDGRGRGRRLCLLWWWSHHSMVTFNRWSCLLHPSLTILRDRKERALLFEKRSGRRTRGCGQSFMAEGDYCGPAVTDFTLLRFTCQISEPSKFKCNLTLLPAYILESFRF